MLVRSICTLDVLAGPLLQASLSVDTISGREERQLGWGLESVSKESLGGVSPKLLPAASLHEPLLLLQLTLLLVLLLLLLLTLLLYRRPKMLLWTTLVCSGQTTSPAPCCPAPMPMLLPSPFSLDRG